VVSELTGVFVFSRSARLVIQGDRPSAASVAPERVLLVCLTTPNLAALTDVETDWHRGVADVGMSRAHTRLHSQRIGQIAPPSSEARSPSRAWRNLYAASTSTCIFTPARSSCS
jgi:hypothetical protein